MITAPVLGTTGVDPGAQLAFRVLGPLTARVGERPVVIAGPRQRAVLATLLMSAGAVVPVEQLAEAVWNGAPPVTARTQVAICVAGLRKAFRAAGYAAEVLGTSPPGYRLAAAPHWLDAQQFRADVECAQAHARAGRTESALDRYARALELWRGPVLADVDSEAVRAAAGRLEEERLSAYERYTALRLELGQHQVLIGELTDLVRQRPLWEQARAHLMIAHYRCGRRAEALALFQEGRRRSIAELGLEPGAALRQTHLAILRDDPVADGPDAPVLAGVSTAATVPAQLLPDQPAFVGRERELTELDAALLADLDPHRPLRWAQLTGAAGVGKTALALHWAHRAAPEFPDGQLFADLRGLDPDHEAVAPAGLLEDFLRALGQPPSQIPAGTDARVALYRSLLARRRVLVVLDNAASFAQIQPLLPGTGTCRVVVTSREPLGGVAPVRLRLGPLPSPEAVGLLRRVLGDRRVDDDLPGAMRLTQLCDRLPLALHSAAARLAAKPHWTVAQLTQRLSREEGRLDELDHGGAGMVARLEQSYRALPCEAARLFRRLGGQPATELPVTDAAALLQVSSAHAEDLLERLVDAQLVEVTGRDQQGRSYFRLAGLPRLYARRAPAR